MRLRLISPALGVHRSVCDQLCADIWRATTGEPVAVDETPVAVGGSCAHCVRCGELVAQPAVCRVHPDGCPEFDPLVTVVLLEVVRKLTAITGRPLTQRAWQYLESCAWTLRANDALGVSALLARMMSLRVDWDAL